MAYQKFSGTYHSSDHKNKIHYYIYEPEIELRAVVQFIHGYGDCIEDNEELIRYFTDYGIMVCGCDLIGHGRSSDPKDYGFFGSKNGWIYLLKDTKRLTRYIKKEYPDTPYFILGHGLGSLIARMDFFSEDGISGIILSGTAGKQKYCRRSVVYAAIVKRIRGARYESGALKRGLYRKLNCAYPLTVAACEDMLKMLALVSRKKWTHSAGKETPVLMLSGEQDPAGGFGKGVRDVSRQLTEAGHTVQLNLYAGMGHDLFKEPRREEVCRDVIEWIMT